MLGCADRRRDNDGLKRPIDMPDGSLEYIGDNLVCSHVAGGVTRVALEQSLESRLLGQRGVPSDCLVYEVDGVGRFHCTGYEAEMGPDDCGAARSELAGGRLPLQHHQR